MGQQPWIYVVLFGLVFIFYAKIMPKAHIAKDRQNATIEEIEETMEHFTAELDEQNKALIQLLAETKREYEAQTAKLSSRIELLEKQSEMTARQLAQMDLAYDSLQRQIPPIGQTQTSVQQEAVQPVPGPAIKAAELELQPNPGMNMKERYSELMLMYDQGKSTDYIAKKLNMNKGEVNLIIQLAKQEERLNAQ